MGVHMRRTVSTAIVMMTLASAAHAQQPAERRAVRPPQPAPAPAAAARPRIGYAASPAPAAQPERVQYFNQPAYYYSPHGYVTTGAPYLVLSDGSVAVNFGNGYERVLRPCAPVSNWAPADPYARDALGRIPEPPGIAAMRAGARGQVGGTMPARNASACYRADAQGRLEIVTAR